MTIFDNLSVADLVKVAALNPHFTDIVLNHYIIGKFRLHEKKIIIFIHMSAVMMYYENSKSDRPFLAQNRNESLFVLEKFGHIFKRLAYEMQVFGGPNWLEIFEYADKYCAQATKVIGIDEIDRAGLRNWTYSFDHTATQIRLWRVVSLPLNVLFPFMEILHVKEMVLSILQHYPHLTECSIDLNPGTNSNVDQFVRLNPQLRSFRTPMTTDLSFFAILSEMLTNLEKLAIKITIDPRDVEPQIVQFKNVTEFTVELDTKFGGHTDIRNAINNIQFVQLETFKIVTPPVADSMSIPFLDDPLIEMIVTNRELKKIELSMRVTRQSFNELRQELLELKEISIYWHSQMLDSFDAFFDENHGLSKINIYNCFPRKIEDFDGKFPINWEISAIETATDSFTFIRKN